MRISQAIKLLQAWQDQIGDVPLTSRDRFLAGDGDYEVNINPQICELGLLLMPQGDRIFLAIDGGGFEPGKAIDFDDSFLNEVAEKEDKGNLSDGYHTFNELYEHRHALFALACSMFGGWKSRQHNDGTMFEGSFIAGIGTPQGPVTYHLPLRLWDAFPGREEAKAPPWDGHTSKDVVGRLWSMLSAPNLQALLTHSTLT